MMKKNMNKKYHNSTFSQIKGLKNFNMSDILFIRDYVMISKDFFKKLDDIMKESNNFIDDDERDMYISQEVIKLYDEFKTKLNISN